MRNILCRRTFAHLFAVVVAFAFVAASAQPATAATTTLGSAVAAPTADDASILAPAGVEDLPFGIKGCPLVPGSATTCELLPVPELGLTPGPKTNWQQGKFVCVGDGKSGPRVHVFAAVVKGKSVPHAEIQQYVHWVDAVFDLSASRHGGRRVVRWAAENCGTANARVKVTPLPLPADWHTSEDRTGLVEKALAAAGYQSLFDADGTEKYLVFVPGEGFPWKHPQCGEASMPTLSDRPFGVGWVIVDVKGCSGREGVAAAHELIHALGIPHLDRWGDNRPGENYPYINDIMMYTRCYTYEECVKLNPECANPYFQRLADCKGDKYFNPRKDATFGRKLDPVYLPPNIAVSPFLADPGGAPLPPLYVDIEHVYINVFPWGAVDVAVEWESLGANGQVVPAKLTVTGPSKFTSDGDWAYAESPKLGKHTATVVFEDGKNRITRSWDFVITDDPSDFGSGGNNGGGAGSGRFRDVPDGSVFFDDIERLADSGITKGCNPPRNDRFCPDDYVTRGQMAAFLVRAFGLKPGKASFRDIKGHVFQADVAALADAGITKGCNPPRNDRFCPDAPVTRGQMAAFLVRALGLPQGTTKFTDTKGNVFSADIAALADAGITKGCNPPRNDRFCPDDYVTRGQMAAFLVRAGLAG